MEYQELIRNVSSLAGITQEEARNTIGALVSAIRYATRDGKEVAIPKLGRFHVSRRASRPGRNPITGEAVTIEARNVIAFKPAQSFKELVR